MLIVFGGLPGTGKTTIAREVARRCRATYLRIDAIEQAVRAANVLADGIGPAGYLAAYALAEANLQLDQSVVADCVNPLALTRTDWRRVAERASSAILEIELICSDTMEHRRRVETRSVDIPGLVPPSWSAVLERQYEPWPEPHIVIDTAHVDADNAVSMICEAVDRERDLSE